MNELGLYEEDIEEQFVRSSGKGGQHVNQVATCVVLKHLPSGIQIKVQQERTQLKNRIIARELLVEKYQTQLDEEKAKEKARIEQEKRKKRKRPKKLQEKILEEKRKKSALKTLRGKVDEQE